MKHKLFMSIVIGSMIVSGCSQAVKSITNDQQQIEKSDQAQEDIRGTISISGAFALYPMMTRWAEEFQKEYPNVQFDISAGGAGKGMTDALSGAVDIGMISREIKQEEQDQGAFWVAVTKDAVFPVINIANPVIEEIKAKGISKDTFRKIFITGEITSWGQVTGNLADTEEIHVYTRSDACGAAEEWAKFIGGAQEDLLGIGVNADPGLLDAVVNDPIGIGYNNLNYAFDFESGNPAVGAFIVPIDINDNGLADSDEVAWDKNAAVELIASGKFPSPPARDLTLVTNGKPEGVVQFFLNWILTKGQSFVDETGYIQLPAEKITENIGKLQ